MDERVFRAKIGQPIPEWDMAHRLPISGNVSPEIRDSATVFRINSLYMDVSDQPHMMRQWLAGGGLISFLAMLLLLYAAIVVLVIKPPTHWDAPDLFMVSLVTLGPLFFGCIAVRLGRGEYFALTRRPIRFHNKEKKIYAIRQRQSPVAGDLIWQIPWDESAVFCVHKGPAKFDLEETYHIRYYKLDDEANVVRAFALGREWQNTDGMRDLLAQWNYWCEYMNHGPENLPKPLLYLSEHESLSESFLYCLYEIGFGISGAFRTILSPFVLVLTSHRLMSMWTCRHPVWPDEVLNVSRVAHADPHDQPSGNTPVGWRATVRARREGRYPRTPSGKADAWIGDLDPMANARRWEADKISK